MRIELVARHYPGQLPDRREALLGLAPVISAAPGDVVGVYRTFLQNAAGGFSPGEDSGFLLKRSDGILPASYSRLPLDWKPAAAHAFAAFMEDVILRSQAAACRAQLFEGWSNPTNLPALTVACFGDAVVIFSRDPMIERDMPDAARVPAATAKHFVVLLPRGISAHAAVVALGNAGAFIAASIERIAGDLWTRGNLRGFTIDVVVRPPDTPGASSG